MTAKERDLWKRAIVRAFGSALLRHDPETFRFLEMWFSSLS